MKNNIIKITLLLLILAIIVPVNGTEIKMNLTGENFKLNPNVGPIELRFKSSAPLEEIKGSVKPELATSNVNVVLSNFEKTSGRISFKAADIETGIKTRDGHLRGSDWLDAGNFPQIVFDLKEFKNIKIVSSDNSKTSAEVTALGTYTMHGKSKLIEIPVRITIVMESDATRKRAPGDFLFVDGQFDIALKDFNVKGKADLVGSKVGEIINISFKLFYNNK